MYPIIERSRLGPPHTLMKKTMVYLYIENCPNHSLIR